MKCRYYEVVQPRLDQIRLWIAKGATNQEVFKKLGISEDTFYKYVQKFPEFAEAIERSRAEVDDRVEASLYKRCVGYDYEEVTKSQVMGPGGKIIWLEKRTTKHLPPDPASIQFWLTNRRKSEWRRMPETGPDDGSSDSGVVILPEVQNA